MDVKRRASLAINGITGLFGFRITRASKKASPVFSDQPQWVQDIVRKVKPYTMTTPERIIAVCHGVQYITENNIAGDIVECGVWRGGSMMAAALTLRHFNDASRHLHLYDTFDGMPPPTEKDVRTSTGVSADSILQAAGGYDRLRAPLDDVRENLATTDYPMDKMTFVKGKVENTIPANCPDEIALLRLDTDWYESTKHELEHLYPRLTENGVMIIDDYGHWAGAQKAVDEYVERHRLPLFLARVDYTGRVAIKHSV